MSGTAMGPGEEFDLIRRLVRIWGARAIGIGDDAAVLRVPPGMQLVATTDAAVDRVHFRRDWCTPDEIGHRAATAAISDIAAMAATPLGVLVALAVPHDCLTLVEEIGRGIGEAVAVNETAIIGGNVTRAGELSITTTVLGYAAHPVMRSGAIAGQAVYVTGRFGGPAAAVNAWTHGAEPDAEWRLRYARPAARLREAKWLAERGATAAIDISDGLLADLAHVAHASGVRLQLELDTLPVVAGVDIERAARGGDEYELAVTAPPGLDLAAFHDAFGTPLTRIGLVHAGAPDVQATLAGARVAPDGGWDHLS
jgi:thiamine-monophosphate kinase